MKTASAAAGLAAAPLRAQTPPPPIAPATIDLTAGVQQPGLGAVVNLHVAPAAEEAPAAGTSGCEAAPWLRGVDLSLRLPVAAPGSSDSYKLIGTATKQELVGGGCARVTANKHGLLRPGPAGNQVAVVNPFWLFTPGRFDLLAKYRYAVDRVTGRRSKWGLRLYSAHLAAFNGFQEHDPPQPPKRNLVDFLLAYDRVLDAFRGQNPAGLNASTLIPVGSTTGGAEAAGGGGGVLGPAGGGGGVAMDAAITDGAHRLSAAAAFRRPAQVVAVGGGAGSYNAEFFAQRGLAPVYMDAMAVDWLRCRPAAGRVFLIWPAATARPGGLAAALSTLRQHGEVVYARAVALLQPAAAHAGDGGTGRQLRASDGAELLIRTIYAGEDWLPGGGTAKADRCFDTAGSADAGGAAAAMLHVVVFAPRVPSTADSSGVAAAVNAASRAVKLEVRALPELAALSHDAVHSTDSPEESLAVAELLLTSPGRHLVSKMRARWESRTLLTCDLRLPASSSALLSAPSVFRLAGWWAVPTPPPGLPSSCSCRSLKLMTA
eukprot:SAG22_NODE_1924_length_3307_cov_1.297693_3_plen_545_part_00